MKRWWQRFKAWHSRRDERWIRWWTRQRTSGLSWFVVRSTALFSVGVLTMYEVFSHQVGFFTIVSTHCIGLVGAYFGWRENERKFQRLLDEARRKAASAGVLPERPSLGLNS
jgi:hypothetical protein